MYAWALPAGAGGRKTTQEERSPLALVKSFLNRRKHADIEIVPGIVVKLQFTKKHIQIALLTELCLVQPWR